MGTLSSCLSRPDAKGCLVHLICKGQWQICDVGPAGDEIGLRVCITVNQIIHYITLYLLTHHCIGINSSWLNVVKALLMNSLGASFSCHPLPVWVTLGSAQSFHPAWCFLTCWFIKLEKLVWTHFSLLYFCSKIWMRYRYLKTTCMMAIIKDFNDQI